MVFGLGGSWSAPGSIMLYDLLGLLQQVFELESSISLAELLQKPLPPSLILPAAIEFLETHQEPPPLVDRHSSPLDDTAFQQNQALLSRQLQVMRDGRMRLAEFPLSLNSAS